MFIITVYWHIRDNPKNWLALETEQMPNINLQAKKVHSHALLLQFVVVVTFFFLFKDEDNREEVIVLTKTLENLQLTQAAPYSKSDGVPYEERLLFWYCQLHVCALTYC